MSSEAGVVERRMVRCKWVNGLWALGIAISLYGFQLTGAIADSFKIDSRSLSIALRVLAVVLFLIYLAKVGYRVPRDARELLPVVMGIVFLTYYLNILCFRTLLYGGEMRNSPIEYAGYTILFALMPFLGASAGRTYDAFRKCRSTVGILLLLVCVIYGAPLVLEEFSSFRYRPYDPVNPIGIGYAGLAGVTLASWQWLYDVPTRWSAKVSQLMLFCLGWLLVVVVAERQVIVAALMTVFVFLLLNRGIRQKIRATGLTLTALIVLAALWYLGLSENLVTRVQLTVEKPLDPQREIRLVLWRAAFAEFVQNPILGGHFEVPGFKNYPHNIFLEALMVTGLFWGVLFCAFSVWTLLVALRQLSKADAHGWVGAIHLQSFVWGSLSGALYAHVWYWTSAGLVWALYYTSRRNRQATPFEAVDGVMAHSQVDLDYGGRWVSR